MVKRKYSYDCACEDLAAHFLVGQRVSELALFELAQHIQDAVEAWFTARPVASAYDTLPSDSEPGNEHILNDAGPVGDEGSE